MSAPKKIYGDSPGIKSSEVRRFKSLWRSQLTEEQKIQFLSWFDEPGISHAQIRERVHKFYSIVLKYDKQLSGDGALWSWCLQEQRNAAEAEQSFQEEEDLRLAHPDWDSERLRTELLDRMKRRAIVRGDFKMGVMAIREDRKDRALEFDQEKFKEGLRTKLESGLAELATHIKSNPKAKAAYEALKAEVKIVTK